MLPGRSSGELRSPIVTMWLSVPVALNRIDWLAAILIVDGWNLLSSIFTSMTGGGRAPPSMFAAILRLGSGRVCSRDKGDDLLDRTLEYQCWPT